MSDDTFDLSRTSPQTQRVPSRRDVLWAKLEQEHARLSMPYPTETLTIEELEEEIERLRGLVEQS